MNKLPLPEKFKIRIGAFRADGHVIQSTREEVGENFQYQTGFAGQHFGDGIYIGNSTECVAKALAEARAAFLNKFLPIKETRNIAERSDKYETKRGYYILADIVSELDKNNHILKCILFITPNFKVYQVYEANHPLDRWDNDEVLNHWEKLQIEAERLERKAAL